MMNKTKSHPKLNFTQLLRKIQPTSPELKKARAHTTSCKKRLQKSFDLKKFQLIGSHARKTAIKSYSDLDFLALIAKNDAKWGGNIISSTTFLTKVSQDLNDRFVQTDIRKDGQAVVVSFGGGQNSLDIVPAVFHKFHDRKPIFLIPDGAGNWLETSPAAHNSYINTENRRSVEKLKKLGQLIRFWKHTRASSIPISSFYIDLLLARTGICLGAKTYPQMLYEFFKLMYDRKCRGLRDPVGIAGNVYAVQTTAKGNKLLSAIDNSLDHAGKAIIAEHHKNFIEANRQWNIVFNNNFL